MARGKKQITLSLQKQDNHLLFRFSGVVNANVTKETLHSLIRKNGPHAAVANYRIWHETTGKWEEAASLSDLLMELMSE
jgi:hypothetical protein